MTDQESTPGMEGKDRAPASQGKSDEMKTVTLQAFSVPPRVSLPVRVAKFLAFLFKEGVVELNRLVWHERHEKARGVVNFFWRSLQITFLSIGGYFKNQCGMRASALTYRTFLSFVPLLALTFVVLKALDYQQVIAEKLLHQVTAGSKEVVDEAVQSIVDAINKTVDSINRTKVKGLTGIGIIGLLVVGISMLQTVEQALNDIWRVRKGRNLPRMIIEYLTLIILGPLLLTFAVYMSTILKAPDTMPYGNWINNAVIAPLLSLAPHVAIWAVFIFIYFYMPNARIYWLSAFIGGTIAGSLWHLAQLLYIQLTIRFYAQSYNLVYGALAWLFILIIWVYISWSILLFGAEIAYAHQHLDDHRRRNRLWKGTPADMETLTLRVGSLLARPWMESASRGLETRISFEQLSDILRIPPAPIQDTLKLMTTAELVDSDPEEKLFRLARPPETVSVLDLLRLVRHGSLRSAKTNGESQPAGNLAEIGTLLSERLSQMTLKTLAEMPVDQVQTLELSPVTEPLAG
ncbi:YihY/virulence factor BrkB family protein [Candidatus Sumerlaeota bacterium]|nr:YihY/virulence factor BrkB family protein [Candidatus Sumerlaeota bacterium]